MRLKPHRAALADQLLALVRQREGFPVSTGELARDLGDRLVTYHYRPPTPALPPRPSCWPNDLKDPETVDKSFCWRCGWLHRMPVWRHYEAQDIRSLLNSLAKRGHIEKVALDGVRTYYWRGAVVDIEATT